MFLVPKIHMGCNILCFSDQIFCIFQIKFVWMSIDINDLVHDMETVFGLCKQLMHDYIIPN